LLKTYKHKKWWYLTNSANTKHDCITHDFSGILGDYS
jgi:hypothetical protein